MVEKKGHHLPIPLKKFNLTARRRCGIHKKDLAQLGYTRSLMEIISPCGTLTVSSLNAIFVRKLIPYPWQRTETLLKTDNVELFA